jgi:hypothetical protein
MFFAMFSFQGGKGREVKWKIIAKISGKIYDKISTHFLLTMGNIVIDSP